MSEREHRSPSPWSLDRDRLELEQELRGLDEPHERGRLRAELQRIHTTIAERGARRDLLATLPDFWTDLYGTGKGSLALFSGLRDGPRLRNPHSAYYPWPAAAATATAWVAHEADAGRELYQCGHLVTRPQRRKADAAPLAALYVDLDHAHLSPDVPPPSIIVESSPGRWQCYWRLSSPVPPAVGEGLNRRLADALGADMTGWDLTQLLRVPGTPNRKYPTQPLVRVLRASDTTYHPDELLRLLPADCVPAPDPPAPAQPVGGGEYRGRTVPGDPPPDTGEPPVPLRAAALRVWQGADAKRRSAGSIDRSASLVKLARVLYDAGATRETIVAALAERDARLGWDKYTARADATAQYARVVAVVERGGRTGCQPRGDAARAHGRG